MPLMLMRERCLRLGKVELAVALEESWAARLTGSFPYRYLVWPLLNWLQRRFGADGPGPSAAPWPPPPLAPDAAPQDPEARRLLDRIAGVHWYHTIDLGHGVVTPGFADHRSQVPLYGLPADIRGKRCLDVGSGDGFWAFEMERRGAQEVVAIDVASAADLDYPRRCRPQALETTAALGGEPRDAGFRLAHELLGSRVRREALSVYDLSPERLGMFDLVFVSDLLIHLRDPQRALESVFSVTREMAIVAEIYNPNLEPFRGAVLTEFLGIPRIPQLPVWWVPSTAWLKAMMAVAGFESVVEASRFVLNARTGSPMPKVVLKGYAAACPALEGAATPWRRERRLRLGRLELAVAAEAQQAERITRSLWWRYLARPALTRVEGLGNRIGAGPRVVSKELPPPKVNLDGADPMAKQLWEQVSRIDDWYQTIELGHGVATPGLVDHRGQVPLYGLPPDLRGKRCLDVGSFDGFWAFEMERRGAQEVVAIDLGSLAEWDLPRRWRSEVLASGPDRPTGAGFRLAQELLGSQVRRELLSVYDLSPERLGIFDLVFVSDLLVHLRDPQRALENVFSVTREMAIVAETYNPALERFRGAVITEFTVIHRGFFWWGPSPGWLKAMMKVAGFEPVEEVSRFVLNARAPITFPKVVLKGHVPPGPQGQA